MSKTNTIGYYDLRTDREAIAQRTDDELQLLDRVQDPRLALQLHTHLGTSALLRGAHGQTQAHHGRVLALYQPAWHQELVLRFSVDPAVVAGVVSGCSLWLLGWPDQARTRLQRGLAWARACGHPYSLCLALMYAARLALWCGAWEETAQLTAEERQLAQAHGLTAFLRQGEIHQGCLHVQRGEPDAGLALLTDGPTPGLVAPSARPPQLCALAEAYRQRGRLAEAQATMAEAIRLTETSANVWWAAEVYGLQGDLLLAAPDLFPSGASPGTRLAEVEHCFSTAYTLARQHGAKALELRAAMRLSRLWQRQDKQGEARRLLAEVYGWFTEGFDTADLQEAHTRLDALR